MYNIPKDSTSRSIDFEILDSTSTTGGRKTGLVYNTASLTAYYHRQGGSATAITLATLAAANSAFSSGGFKEIDATNMPGVYRLDIPDAAIATGADYVTITLKGATGMVQVSHLIKLTPANSEVLSIDSNGRVDVIKVAGTTQTAGDLAALITTVDDLLDTEVAAIKTVVDAILVDTGTTLDAALAVVDANVDAILVDTGTTLDAALAVVDANIDTILADTNDIQTRIPAALTGDGNIKADTLRIDGSATAADALQKSADTIVYGTCDTGSTTTAIATSALSPTPTDADQYSGRLIIFLRTTTTDKLRGQQKLITNSDTSGNLTVEALTTAPVSGDEFVVV